MPGAPRKLSLVDAQPATRERLIVTAMQLFWAKGYGSTSVADLLHEAHANSGSLYHFFPGKQELLIAVLDMYRHRIVQMLLAPAWKGVDDPIERVFALLARYRQSLVSTDCAYGCPIGSLALEIHEPDPPVREAMVANFEAWVSAVHACLDAAGHRLPPEANRRALAEFVLTTMEGAVMQARTHRDIGYFDRSVAQLRGYIDQLIGAETPSLSASAAAVATKHRRRTAPIRSVAKKERR